MADTMTDDRRQLDRGIGGMFNHIRMELDKKDQSNYPEMLACLTEKSIQHACLVVAGSFGDYDPQKLEAAKHEVLDLLLQRFDPEYELHRNGD